MSGERTLRPRLEEEMKTALKARDKDRLGTLRLMLAALKQREIDERITLDDAQVVAVLDKMIKQRRDSIVQYQNARREDLAAKEAAEIAVIQEYLPVPLSEEELDKLIRQALAASGAAKPQDLGKVMALVKPQVQGRADMAHVSRQIKDKLNR